MGRSLVRVVLDGQAFRDLVAGKEVVCGKRGSFPGAQQAPDQPEVHIILSDIGWDVMRAAIDEAQQLVERRAGAAQQVFPLGNSEG